MNPIVDGIRREYKRQLNVVYVDMDKPDGKKLAKQHDVVGTPTFVLLDSEGNKVNVLRGSLPATLIEQAVENLVANQAATD